QRKDRSIRRGRTGRGAADRTGEDAGQEASRQDGTNAWNQGGGQGPARGASHAAGDGARCGPFGGFRFAPVGRRRRFANGLAGRCDADVLECEAGVLQLVDAADRLAALLEDGDDGRLHGGWNGCSPSGETRSNSLRCKNGAEPRGRKELVAPAPELM